MPRKNIIALLIFCFLISISTAAFADKIFLNDGRVIEGNILTNNGMQYYVAVEGKDEPARVEFSDIKQIQLNARSTISAAVKKALVSTATKKPRA